MTTNTERPIAESGFRPRIAPGNGTSFDTAEYALPSSSGLESGFYVEDRGLPWHVTLSRRLDLPELMTGSGTKLTAKDAIVLAGMDWSVAKAPEYARIGKRFVPVPGKNVTYRTDTGAILGSGRGDGYKIVQNVEAFAFADAIVDESDAHYETAGVLFGGRQVFLSMELPDGIHVDGDPSDYRLFLVVSNGHDGKHEMRADVSVERTLCRNTLRVSHERAISSWAIRHTQSLTGRLQEARDALRLTFQYAETFAEDASALVTKTLAERQVDEILRQLFPLTETQEERIAKTPDLVLATTYGKVRTLYHESPTVAPVRGSAYGVLNAITEYVDHAKTYSSEDRRADALIFADAGDVQDRAWKLLASVG